MTKSVSNCAFLLKILLALILMIRLINCIAADIMMDRVKSRNYPIERHFVTTEDGYILGLYRIPQRKKLSSRKVMFMMHGLTASSPDYVFFGEKSAGFYFSDLGYDVWMGNARGTTFSRNHTRLNPDEIEFWHFSWHEIGYYDLPAMIDFALKTTKQSQLQYIGHSMGCTSVFVLLCERPEYNDKIKLVHAMAPVVILKYTQPIFTQSMISDILHNYNDSIEELVRLSGQFEILPHATFGPILQKVGLVCMMISACKYVYFQMNGPSENNYYDRFFYDYSIHFPSGSGYRQYLHYLHLMMSARFMKFDHGTERNIELYGSMTPPDYNVTNIRTKIHIIYGETDYVYKKENIPLVIKLIKPTVVAVTKMVGFNHGDLVYGTRVNEVQSKILAVIKRSPFLFSRLHPLLHQIIS